MVKIKGFEVGKITKKVEERIKQWIDKATANRVDYIERISPVDSGDYISKHKIRKASKQWAYISWWNFNDSENAFWVEFWFRKAPVNWSKKDWTTIYTWTWANVMQRTTLNARLKKETIDIVKQALFGW